MKKSMIWVGIACFSIGFFTGKFSNTDTTISTKETLSTKEITQFSAPINTDQQSTSLTSTSKASSASSILSHNKSAASTASSSSNTTNKPNTAETTDASKQKIKLTTSTEISDESIDSLVPKPFNNAIKNTHGKFRKSYADFLQEENKNAWAADAEAYLNDVLNNGLYGNQIEINSISCMASLCEVRIYERVLNTATDIVYKQITRSADYFSESSTSLSSDENQRTYLVFLFLKK